MLSQISANRLPGEFSGPRRGLHSFSDAARSGGVLERCATDFDSSNLSQEAHDIQGLEATGGISNYLIGSDLGRWTTNVPNYRKVQYTGVCPGVDVTYYGNPQKLEYDFTLSAWADPRAIQMEYEGAESVRLSATGELIVKTAAGDLVQQKPRAYQLIGGRQVEVAAGYRLTPGITSNLPWRSTTVNTLWSSIQYSSIPLIWGEPEAIPAHP